MSTSSRRAFASRRPPPCAMSRGVHALARVANTRGSGPSAASSSASSRCGDYRLAPGQGRTRGGGVRRGGCSSRGRAVEVAGYAGRVRRSHDVRVRFRACLARSGWRRSDRLHATQPRAVSADPPPASPRIRRARVAFATRNRRRAFHFRCPPDQPRGVFRGEPLHRPGRRLCHDRRYDRGRVRKRHRPSRRSSRRARVAYQAT